uniref:Uncharacterized protein n=1 Tax=Roseihalotalea indica TaxID=2867963 RepID=A0AA49JHF7_9BACT|nr:hypothetical protein K4G66_05665 [Tunicatimonas sp. TK19036]
MIAILSYVFLAIYLAGVLYTIGLFFYLMTQRKGGETLPPSKPRKLMKFHRRAA